MFILSIVFEKYNLREKIGPWIKKQAKVSWKFVFVAILSLAVFALIIFALRFIPGGIFDIVFGEYAVFAKWIIGLLLARIFVKKVLFKAVVFLGKDERGVVDFWGKRTGRIVDDGPSLIVPGFHKVPEAISLKPAVVLIETTFTSRNRQGLIFKCTVQYAPDMKLKIGNDSVFDMQSEEAIHQGLVDAIKDKLGDLGGALETDAFISGRIALGQFFNCEMKLSTPPHLDHKKGDPDKCGVPDCEFPDKVPAKDLIEFYHAHFVIGKKKLDGETGEPDDRSSLEQRFGIDIRALDITLIDFTKETKAAFEKEEQAKAEKRAMDEKAKIVDLKIGLVKKDIKETGADPVTAHNSVEMEFHPEERANKKTYSVEGFNNVLSPLVKILSPLVKKLGGE